VITELIIGATLVYGTKYLTDPTRKIRKNWDNALKNCRIEGVRNKIGDTFSLGEIHRTKYGFISSTFVEDGLAVESLRSAKEMLQDNLDCLIEIEKERDKGYITVKFIKEILKFEYAPVQTKSNEIFLGYKLDGSKYILDLNLDPQILIAGMTGTGKSFILAIILTNLIYYHQKDFEIDLFQVKKGEIDIFKNCPAVKFTSDKADEILKELRRLSELIHKRSKLFAEHGIKNITQWNKHFPKRKMKRILIAAEEVSFFMNQGEETNPLFTLFIEIVKAGRSVGIHFVGLTQRTTAANLGGNGELKSQLTVITAKQRTETDSKNAIDISDAAKLERQEFIASANDGYVTFKAPEVDEDYMILNKYVPEIRIPDKCAEEKDEGIKVEVRKAYFAGVLKEVTMPVMSKMNYEESQKLSTYSECYTLENKPEEVEQEVKAEEIEVTIKELPKENKKVKQHGKRRGAVKKEMQEVAISDERN
jgi:hypothetical protein